eukprot:4887561-Pyramimonas_sp.AAC.1
MAPPHPCWHTPRKLRGPIGSCTEGPSGCVRMAPPRPFRHTPHTFRDPMVNSTEHPSGFMPSAASDRADRAKEP